MPPNFRHSERRPRVASDQDSPRRVPPKSDVTQITQGCGGTHFCASKPVRLGPPVRSKTRRGELEPPVRLRQKNVHRVGRVSGGLLNPSGGARDRPRNKSVFAQLKNELNHNFAGRNEIRLTYSGKTKRFLLLPA